MGLTFWMALWMLYLVASAASALAVMSAAALAGVCDREEQEKWDRMRSRES